MPQKGQTAEAAWVWAGNSLRAEQSSAQYILFHESNTRKKSKYRLNNWNLITHGYRWGVIDIKILHQFISYPSQLLIHKEKRKEGEKKEKKGRKKKKPRDILEGEEIKKRGWL